MRANVLSCSKSRSLMIRGVLNDLITRPATNAARALQQFSHCDGYRLSDGALLFVPGRCRAASTGRRRSGARYQRKISWIDQRHAAGGGADGYDGRQAYRGGARRDFAMGPRRCNGGWLRENRTHSHTKVRSVPQCSVWDADFASHKLRRRREGHHTGHRSEHAPVGTRVAHPSVRISMMFVLTGAIFSLSATPIWFRVTVLVIPYLAIIMDIGSWWATKYYDPVFAY